MNGKILSLPLGKLKFNENMVHKTSWSGLIHFPHAMRKEKKIRKRKRGCRIDGDR